MKALKNIQQIKENLLGLKRDGTTNDYKNTCIENIWANLNALETRLLKEDRKAGEVFYLYMSDGTYHAAIKGIDSVCEYLGVKETTIRNGMKRGSLIRGMYVSKSKIDTLDLGDKAIHDACPFDRRKFAAYEYLTLKGTEVAPEFKVRGPEPPLDDDNED